ncbi:HNH endonuclease [Pseudomonas sp. NPDC089741]|uniref:HNH endonuclease n=1 Tax=Pseudomonas sp. NPDC089741 TaxID=3364470 RepID=UPI00382A1B40
MSTPYQEIVTTLIDRMYQKKSSETARVILKKYFTQESSRRKITLDALGKLPELKKVVTRERARQIIANFVDHAFPAELSRLERGLAVKDPITLADKTDIIELRTLLEKLISEITNAPKPVFADRIQSELIKNHVIGDNIYLPIAVQFAQAFGIPLDFYIKEFNDHHIIFDNTQEHLLETRDVIQFAGKVATYFGGLFSTDLLTNSSWNSLAPDTLRDESKENRDYIIDLISSEPDYLELSGGKFYALTSRDERISSILKPIFSCYEGPLSTEKLIPAIKRGLKHIFNSAANEGQPTYVELLDHSDSAIDEFCIAKNFLKETTPGFRVPGQSLIEMLTTYEMTSIVTSQLLVLNMIRAHGAPLESMELGRKIKGKIPDAYKATIHTYPTLYYKDGEGRRKDLYQPLDDDYSIKISLKRNQIAERIEKIKHKIAILASELESLDPQTSVLTKFRAEQHLIREYLLLRHQDESNSKNIDSGACMLCKKTLPAKMLVAAHVKPRAKCTHEERADIDNIAMLQCVTCDALYENGYISIQDNGQIIISQQNQSMSDLNKIYSELEGSITEYANNNVNRLSYLKYHRTMIFMDSRS